MEGRFDTVVDSAFYHVFFDDEETQTRYAQALHKATKPAARLFMFEFGRHNVNGIQWEGLPADNFERALSASGWQLNYLGTSTYLTVFGPVRLDERARRGGPPKYDAADGAAATSAEHHHAPAGKPPRTHVDLDSCRDPPGLILAVPVGATAPAQADCGDPGQPACTGPVPTADQVVAALTQLVDPSIPYQDKADVAENGFTPDEGQQLDDQLGQLGADGKLPFTFTVTDIEPASDNLARATIAVTGPRSPYPRTWPIVLVDQSGNWLITHNPNINSEAEIMQELAECHHPGFPVWKRHYCF